MDTTISDADFSLLQCREALADFDHPPLSKRSMS